MQSVEGKVISRIYGRGRGSVWTPADFGDLGGRDAVDSALSRHARQERIRRIARGLYHYPEKHPLLGDSKFKSAKPKKGSAGKEIAQVESQPTESSAKEADPQLVFGDGFFKPQTSAQVMTTKYFPAMDYKRWQF